jgi:hypothetical protein
MVTDSDTATVTVTDSVADSIAIKAGIVEQPNQSSWLRHGSGARHRGGAWLHQCSEASCP